MFSRCYQTGTAYEIKDIRRTMNMLRVKKELPRMTSLRLRTPDEVYFTLPNVRIVSVAGDGSIAKIKIDSVNGYHAYILREFKERLNVLFPDMIIDDELKLTLKRKWYRSLAPDGSEIRPGKDTLRQLRDSVGKLISFQIHVCAIRMHEDRVIFQPLIRKVIFQEEV